MINLKEKMRERKELKENQYLKPRKSAKIRAKMGINRSRRAQTEK